MVLLEHGFNWAQYFYYVGTPLLATLATLGGVWLKHYLKKRREEKEKNAKDPVVDDVEICKRTYEYLRTMLSDVEADRITVLQFHNGGKFYSGRNIQKMSVSFEEATRGISYTREGRINMPVSYYSDFLDNLVKSGKYVVPDFDGDDANHVRKLFSEGGPTSLFCIPVWSIDNKLIAVLCLEYVKSGASRDELNERADTLKNEANKLSGYLEEVGAGDHE